MIRSMFKITGCIYIYKRFVHLFFRKILVYLIDSYTTCLRKVKKKNPIRYVYVFSEYPETSVSSFYEELMQLFIYFLNTFASLNYKMRDAL